MVNALELLNTLHKLLEGGLSSTADLRQLSVICRNLIASQIDGAGAFLLFALYFENVERLRDGNPIDAEPYETGMRLLISSMEDCLEGIETLDLPKQHAALDSFARTAQRLLLP